MSKYVAPKPLLALLSSLKRSPRAWKSRHLVFTSISSTFNSRRVKNLLVRTNILHLFKGSFPDDREVDRLLITEFSRVFVPDDHPNIAGRQCVLKAVGYSAKELRRDSSGALVLKGETTWMFQCPDSQAMKEWVLSIRNVIRNDKYCGITIVLVKFLADCAIQIRIRQTFPEPRTGSNAATATIWFNPSNNFFGRCSAFGSDASGSV